MLSPESVTDRIACFLEDHSIQTKCIESNLSIGIGTHAFTNFSTLSHLHQMTSVDRSDLSLPIAESTVIDVLKLITNKSNLPILVTCRSGKRITGLIIGCLRKLQRWSLVSILEEYRSVHSFFQITLILVTHLIFH